MLNKFTIEQDDYTGKDGNIYIPTKRLTGKRNKFYLLCCCGLVAKPDFPTNDVIDPTLNATAEKYSVNI